jgi:hypothetical protein
VIFIGLCPWAAACTGDQTKASAVESKTLFEANLIHTSLSSSGCTMLARKGSGQLTSRTRVSPLHLHPTSPVPGFAPAMRDGENDNFSGELSIDDAERKLPEDVFSEISKVEGPALGSGPDRSTACSKAVSKLSAARPLRSLYQPNDVRYSCSAWG